MDSVDELEKLRIAKNECYAQLLKCPVFEISGLVSSLGPSVNWTRGDDHHDLVFDLPVWRIEGCALNSVEIRVLQIGNQVELDKIIQSIETEGRIRFRAHYSDQFQGKPVQAALVELLDEEVIDPELDCAVREYLTPKIFRDDRFGKFLFDRSLNWYNCQTRWLKTSINLTLIEKDEQRLKLMLCVTDSLFDHAKKWDNAAREYAAFRLLNLKNRSWLDEDNNERPVTERKFKKRITMQSICINPDFSFDFWFDDGGLFFGHQINVTGNLEEGFTHAGI
ncbi:MAG: DUF2262 domain-containing protein [Planctomycetaceae bacterium]|nr:DUF2262 domain-containing protein [Planctomycetaceae bacterium]